MIGVDPVSGTYQVITANNQSLRLGSDEIDRAEKTMDSKYQESGPDKDNQSQLTIKDTPFNVDK